MPSSSAEVEVAPVLGGQRRKRQHDVRHVHALAVRQRAADDHLASRRSRVPHFSTCSRKRPSSSSRSAPGFERREDLRMRQATRASRRRACRSRSRRNAAPSTQHRPGRWRRCRRAASGPCRSSQHADGPADLALDLADQRRAAAWWSLVRAVAEVEPEHVGTGIEQRPDHVPCRRSPGRAWRRSSRACCFVVSFHAVAPCCRAASMHDGAKVVHIGQRRPGHHRVAERLEEAVSVVVVEALARLQALRPRAGQRVGREQRAGDLFLAVDAVGVAGQRVDAGLPVERDAPATAGTRRCARRGPVRAR